MQLFYTSTIENGRAVLLDKEAYHCTHVLRKRVGDTIHVVDGKGGWYDCRIADIAKKDCTLDILDAQYEHHKRSFRTHIAIAPPKNIARLEWFLEKATEIGVEHITPLHCQRSERKKIRFDRLHKILVAAMKQSLKAYLPQLHDWMTVSDFVQQHSGASAQKFIAHCAYEKNMPLQKQYHAGKDVIIMVGPEGDFTDVEVTNAHQNQFLSVGLGHSRLRTETAGIVACHTIALLNE